LTGTNNASLAVVGLFSVINYAMIFLSGWIMLLELMHLLSFI